MGSGVCAIRGAFVKYKVAHPMPLGALIEKLGDLVIKVTGPADLRIAFLANLAASDGAEAIAFCSLHGPVAVAAVEASGAGVIICHNDVFASFAGRSPAKSLIAADDPRLVFALAGRHLLGADPGRAESHSSASIAATARIGENVRIGVAAVVGAGCIVGAESDLDAGVVLHPGTEIGQRCRIESGAVLGARGFGFVRDVSGKLQRFPQLGRTIIGDDVEIGAHACVDCGSLQDTVIASGTKVDDLAYIAHNVTVGRDCLIMAGAVLCGGCRIGDGVEIAPGAVIRENLTIGAHARIGLGAVVTKDVPEHELVAGVPARSMRPRREHD